MNNRVRILQNYPQNGLPFLIYEGRALARGGFFGGARRTNMGFSFDGSRGRGGSRGGRNAAFFIAVGLCCAAVFLVALSALINSRAGAGGDGRSAESFIAPLDGSEASAEGFADASEVSEPSQRADAQEADALPEGVAGVTAGADGDPADAGAMGLSGVAGDLAAATVDTVQKPAPEAAQAADAPEIPDSSDAVEASAEPISAAAAWQQPLEGSLLKPFSGSELVFCATMGDWRVHEGTDIAANAGDEVRSATDGTVIDFTEDMLFGYTAVIAQDDGTMLYYSGLGSTQLVTAGMTVKCGDIIGFVGEVPCEAADGPHLHFAVRRDNRFTDPMELLGD